MSCFIKTESTALGRETCAGDVEVKTSGALQEKGKYMDINKGQNTLTNTLGHPCIN